MRAIVLANILGVVCALSACSKSPQQNEGAAVSTPRSEAGQEVGQANDAARALEGRDREMEQQAQALGH